MIFLTTGTQEPFDRLLRMVDDIAPLLGEKIIAQSLPGKYHPVNFDVLPFISAKDFHKFCNESRCIVSHAGMGTILESIATGTPLVVVPRSAQSGEHRNDHQFSTVEKLPVNNLIKVVTDKDNLLGTIEDFLRYHPKYPCINPDYSSLTQRVLRFLNTE